LHKQFPSWLSLGDQLARGCAWLRYDTVNKVSTGFCYFELNNYMGGRGAASKDKQKNCGT